jgi:hypothetical protein
MKTLNVIILFSILALLAIIGIANAQDLETPTAPGTYSSVFVALDLRGYSAETYSNWAVPGDSYCRAAHDINCDHTEATALQISTAKATWNSMTQCNRYRIRLFHSGLRFDHSTLQKVHVIYTTNIPTNKRATVAACQITDEIEYAGATFSQACAYLNAKASNLCTKFWPDGIMNRVVLGWEADAN